MTDSPPTRLTTGCPDRMRKPTRSYSRMAGLSSRTVNMMSEQCSRAISSTRYNSSVPTPLPRCSGTTPTASSAETPMGRRRCRRSSFIVTASRSMISGKAWGTACVEAGVSGTVSLARRGNAPWPRAPRRGQFLGVASGRHGRTTTYAEPGWRWCGVGMHCLTCRLRRVRGLCR